MWGGEPFSALDPLIREHLQDELLDLQRRLGKTILFVSHDLNEALKLGRHIAIMEAGRIVQFGEPEEIVLRPANAYVAEFIAHMDALNVLRCGSLMTPVDEIRRSGDTLLLDWSGLNRLSLNEAGEPVEASVEASPPPIPRPAPGVGAAPPQSAAMRRRWTSPRWAPARSARRRRICGCGRRSSCATAPAARC